MHKRNLFKLSLGHIVTDINPGAIPMLLAFLQPVFGLTQTQVGLAVLFSNVSSSVIQPAFGVASDRKRQPLLMPAGCLVAGLGMALAGYVPNYVLLLAAVAFSGLGVAAFHPEASRYARFSSGEKKASGMSIFSFGGNIGMAAGPVLATVMYSMAHLKGTLGFLVLSALMALVLYISLPDIVSREDLHKPAADKYPRGTSSIKKILSNAALVPVLLLLLIVIFRSFIQFGVITFAPQYYLNQLHRSGPEVTLIVALFMAAGAAGTLIGGPLADRWGMKRFMIISMAVQSPLMYLFFHSSGILTAVGSTLLGFAVISTMAVTLVFVQELLPNNLGFASGLIIGFGVGMGGVGATLIGNIADHWGLLTALDSMMILPVLTLLLTLFLPRDPARVRRCGAEQPDSPQPEQTC